MAVVVRKSLAIANRDASPRVITNPGILEGMLKSFVGTLETVSGDSIGSTYILGQVPSNAHIRKIQLNTDDIGATTIADIGVYRTTADGSAVVDADFFGSAVSLKDGALDLVAQTHESGVYGKEDIEKALWDALGLAKDSQVHYDIVMTLTGAADAAATIAVICDYSV